MKHSFLESAEEAKAAAEAEAGRKRRLLSYGYYGIAAAAAIIGTFLWRYARTPDPEPPEVTVQVSAPVTAPTLHPALQKEMAEPPKTAAPAIEIKPRAAAKPTAAKPGAAAKPAGTAKPAPAAGAATARKQPTTKKTVAAAAAEAKRLTTNRPANPNGATKKPVTSARD